MNATLPMEWIDIGLNLAHADFDADREAVLARAQGVGVRWMIVTGSTAADSAAALELATRHPHQLRATLGVHPHHAQQWQDATARTFATLAQDPRVVALGETGLDYYRNHSTPTEQRRAFAAQLELAADRKLPVFLHERAASQDFGKILERYRDALPRAVVHCFTSDAYALAHYLEMDCHIGVTGWICDERRGQELQELVARIPSQRLLVETDAPYLLPRTLAKGRARGRRNEPAFLPEVGAAVARHTGRTLADIAASTTANARAFFALPAAELPA